MKYKPTFWETCMPWEFEHWSRLHAMNRTLKGVFVVSVVFYECDNLVLPKTDCSYCRSLAFYEPFYHCKWCGDTCVSTKSPCNETDTIAACPDPEINKVKYTVSCNQFPASFWIVNWQSVKVFWGIYPIKFMKFSNSFEDHTVPKGKNFLITQFTR